MPFKIIRADMTKLPMQVDAIVNTANPKSIIGQGMDSSIYNNANREKLLLLREKAAQKAGYENGEIPKGKAIMTPACNLYHAQHIIHAVATRWKDGNQGEAEILKQAYLSALECAKDGVCRSVAFSLMGTGYYRFPRQIAMTVAVSAFAEFLLQWPALDLMIYLVVFDKESYQLACKLMLPVPDYISTDETKAVFKTEYTITPENLLPQEDGWQQAYQGGEALAKRLIDQYLKENNIKNVREYMMQETSANAFWARVRYHMMNKIWICPDDKLRTERKGFTDAQVYHGGNISKQQWNRQCNHQELPISRTFAVKTAFGLHLTLEETQELVAMAGYSFPAAGLSETILASCIQCSIYECKKVNNLLDTYGQLPFFASGELKT